MTFMGCAEMVNYVNSNGEREIPPIKLEKLNLTVLMGRSMFYAFFQTIPFRRQIKNAFFKTILLNKHHTQDMLCTSYHLSSLNLYSKSP